jgi:outer membrane protein TolC
VIADQQTLVNLQIQELVTTVQLIAALGGGWDRSQLPSTQKVSQDPSAQETKIQQ